MAAFCGTCGKPVVGDAQFCGGCGARTSSSNAAQTAPPSAPSPVINAAPAATGTSALKIILIFLVIAGAGLAAVGTGAYFYGRNKIAQWKKDNGVADSGNGISVLQAAAAAAAHHVRSHGSGSATLTKEEVSAIILKPVTELEMQSEDDAHYKTATPGYEATIEVERKDDAADAKQSFDAARMVTKGAGGKAESVPGIGDDALYGAFNVLYVIKNDFFLTIMPPNLQQAAQLEEHDKVMSLPMGSDAQRAALEKMAESMKGDPAMGSLSKPDAMSGAVDLIRHSATETGNEYQTKSRLMARQLAEKVLSKMGT